MVTELNRASRQAWFLRLLLGNVYSLPQSNRSAGSRRSDVGTADNKLRTPPDPEGSAPPPAEASPFTTVGLTAADRQETTGYGPVVVQWRWGACDGGLLEESNDAATFQLTVDGRVVGGGSMVQYRTHDRPFGELRTGSSTSSGSRSYPRERHDSIAAAASISGLSKRAVRRIAAGYRTPSQRGFATQAEPCPPTSNARS